MDLSGKVSVITGASQGIGEAIALELSGAGAEVILVDIQEKKLEEVVGKVKDRGGKAALLKADVSDLKQVNDVVETVVKNHNKVDHLINNAGITRDNLMMRMKEGLVFLKQKPTDTAAIQKATPGCTEQRKKKTTGEKGIALIY